MNVLVATQAPDVTPKSQAIVRIGSARAGSA